MNKIKENCVQRINDFLNGEKMRTLSKIRSFLLKELSCHRIFWINNDLNTKFKKIHEDKTEYYTRHMVRIYFPFENTLIFCSTVIATQIPIVNAILANLFKESVINFKYRDNALKTEFDGPSLIIVENTLDSIILANSLPITAMFSDY